MKSVEIYDQFKNVFSQEGTLIHASSGFTFREATDLTDTEALAKVEELYEASKLLGTYTDKMVFLDKGYAELVINFDDGRVLNRVIYTV